MMMAPKAGLSAPNPNANCSTISHSTSESSVEREGRYTYSVTVYKGRGGKVYTQCDSVQGKRREGVHIQCMCCFHNILLAMFNNYYVAELLYLYTLKADCIIEGLRTRQWCNPQHRLYVILPNLRIPPKTLTLTVIITQTQ